MRRANEQHRDLGAVQRLSFAVGQCQRDPSRLLRSRVELEGDRPAERALDGSGFQFPVVFETAAIGVVGLNAGERRDRVVQHGAVRDEHHHEEADVKLQGIHQPGLSRSSRGNMVKVL